MSAELRQQSYFLPCVLHVVPDDSQGWPKNVGGITHCVVLFIFMVELNNLFCHHASHVETHLNINLHLSVPGLLNLICGANDFLQCFCLCYQLNTHT
jgi:hypothetical protein